MPKTNGSTNEEEEDEKGEALHDGQEPLEKPTKSTQHIDEVVQRHEVHSLLDELKKGFENRSQKNESRLDAIELALKSPPVPKTQEKENEDGSHEEKSADEKTESKPKKKGWRLWRTF